MNATNIITLIGFVPTIVLLFFVLGKFEGYFIDNKAFFLIFLGMIIGLFIGIFSFYIPIYDFFWALALISLIELIKLLILMQKPFRLKHDATFYGMGLGIGIASTMIFVYGFYSGLTELQLITVSAVFLLSYNYNLIHGSTGAIIGYGSYRGEFWNYFFKAFIISGGHSFLMTLVWITDLETSGGEVRIFSLLIIGGIYATLVLLYVYNEIIPKSIPKELKKAREKLA